MAMKKAEMEAASGDYKYLMMQARAAERDGLFRRAVELAIASWDHIDGMMKYERKYSQEEFGSIRAIEMVLRYAPLLLDVASLEKLQELLKQFRGIEKNTSESLGEKLAAARALMWEAHRLWEHVERHPGIRQDTLRRDLGGDQEKWRSVAEGWERMGLLFRTQDGRSYTLALTTRLGQVVKAKCPACAHIGEAPKAMFLEEMPCPECGASALFVILATRPGATSKE